MSIVTEDLLVGHFNISINKHEKTFLADFIDRYEKKYLMDLFGPDFYDYFISDLSGTSPQSPQTAPYSTIFDCFQICTPCGQIFNCDGLRDMIIGFVYYHYNSEQWLKKTASGTVVNDSENSTVRASAQIGLANYWNDAVQNYELIQLYICENIDLFKKVDTDKFTGIKKEFMPLT